MHLVKRPYGIGNPALTVRGGGEPGAGREALDVRTERPVALGGLDQAGELREEAGAAAGPAVAGQGRSLIGGQQLAGW